MPTKLLALRNDDELTRIIELLCILALVKIALIIIMENGVNGRRITDYHLEVEWL